MRVHFIGIGGIGVSALARYYLAKGHQVSGSDLVSSEITDALKKLGAKIFIGPHKPQNISISTKPGLVVCSPAVPKDNPELREAEKRRIKCQTYPQALGALTKKYFTIAVCGSHGKSTVAAMLGLILTRAGFDPTVIVGTKLKEFGDSNCRVGESQYLVIEADEHFASFLNYWPKIIVLTALEKDHLDYFKNFKNYILAFKKFISHLSKDGVLVANGDDKRILQMLKSKTENQKSKICRFHRASSTESGQFKIQKYSLKQKEEKKLRKILKIPGEFNVANALAALTTARALKIQDKISFRALGEYKGSWRRFEEKDLKIKNLKFKIINDYAHHPTQVEATLIAARDKFPKNKIWCVYQPHQYQRTYYLFNDFVNVFAKAPVDKLIITDIYNVAGREDKAIKRKVSSEKLIKAIKNPNAIYLPRGKIVNYLRKNLQGSPPASLREALRAGEVVIIMGAGDIYCLSKELENR